MTARPRSLRTRLTIEMTTVKPTMIPITPLITFTEVLGRTGSCHARQLAVVSARLRVRPVVAMPNSPKRMASQRVELGWFNAVLICWAITPVTPAAWEASSALTWLANEADDADDEQQQWHEEQEQAEGDRAGDDGAGAGLVPVVQPHAEIDDRPVAVLVERGVRPGLPGGDAQLALGEQPFGLQRDVLDVVVVVIWRRRARHARSVARSCVHLILTRAGRAAPASPSTRGAPPGNRRSVRRVPAGRWGGG